MLAKRIIACLDVKGGRVVKGKNFIGLKDAGKPAELARRYAREGADEIVFLDISASSEKRKTRRKWVAEVAAGLDIPFTVGGGISSVSDVREILSLGADKIALNTAALNRPALISEVAAVFGSQCVVMAIDAKRAGNGWQAYAYGGTRQTGRDAVEWAEECAALGAGEILATSIDRDGTGKGFDCGLTKAIALRAKIPVIASGGAGRMDDFTQALTSGKADAVLAAGVFHRKEIGIGALKRFMRSKGILVRG